MILSRIQSQIKVLTLLPVLSLQVCAEDSVLASWYDFSAGFQLYRFSGTPKASDISIPDVNANLWGSDGTRDVWGSTDGTYGSAFTIGNSDTNGCMSLRTNRDFIDFTITNNTSGGLLLSSIHFDFASVNNNSPENLNLYYLNGDLTIPDSTLIQSWEDIHNNLGTISNYEDVDVSLTELSDRTLAAGQTAKFRFQVDTASNQFQAMLLDNIAIMGSSSEFRIVTYNIHGGLGPEDEGDIETNLQAFRDTFMKDPDVLCFQEVGSNSQNQTASDWTKVKSIFPDYPYTFQTVNLTTNFFFFPKATSIAVLSKHPFESTHSQLIQVDPQGDEWERHAQHVQIMIGGKMLDIFHFHNTFNFFDNDYQSEKAGLTKFKDYVLDRTGAASIANADNLLLLGDFNVRPNNVIPILASPSLQSHVLDHVAGSKIFSSGGNYNTVVPDLSDHRAVWVSLDMSPPTPNIPLWSTTPTETGTTSITMAAAPVIDPNEVEYLFTNETLSRNSGWQSSPTFTDTGLTPATSYAYKIRARDKSANRNITELSEVISTTTDDGDNLPNDWEILYFSNLTTSTGTQTEDADNDGTSDFDEWVAGTSPVDSSSLFEAWLNEDQSSGDTSINWSSVAGRTYRVMASRTLNADWVEVASKSSSAGADGNFEIDTTDGEKHFYRIEVSQ